MALAKIKMTMPGITSVSGMTAKLFAHPGAIDAAAVATGLVLTVDAVDTDTYWTEVDATLLSVAVYLIKATEGTTNYASGYVKITNTTNVHVVCETPNLADIDGTTAVVKWGAITDRTAIVDLTGTTVGLTAAAITAIWAALTASMTTVGSIGKFIVDSAAASLSAASVWSYSSRTLTQTAAAVASAIDGDAITIHRGDTVVISITGLGSLASRTGEKLWFTVKRHDTDVDSAAVIQVGETTGAIYLNGAATTAAYASLVVTDQVTGAITITLKPALTSQLVDATLSYDIQILETALVRTLTYGTAVVTADITRAIG